MADNNSGRAKQFLWRALKSKWLADSARTGLAMAASLAIASLFKMPEAYWAPVTTIMVLQSTLGAAWTVSKLRLIGTALGAATGALLANYVTPGIVVFGVAIFVLGLICALLRLDQTAYRFAGITLTIVVLIVRAQPAYITGLHRFIEVALGIAVALIFSAIWPQRELPASEKPPGKPS